MIHAPVDTLPVYARGVVAGETLIDIGDFEWLNEHRWRLSYWGYAERTVFVPGVGYRALAMHREIMSLGYGDRRVVHHDNEDGLDNRRSNLIVCANASAHARMPHRRRDGLALLNGRAQALAWAILTEAAA